MMSIYKVVVDISFDGHHASGAYQACSIWTKRNGESLSIFYTSVKATPARPAE